jgi:hypothetical protein
MLNYFVGLGFENKCLALVFATGVGIATGIGLGTGLDNGTITFGVAVGVALGSLFLFSRLLQKRENGGKM